MRVGLSLHVLVTRGIPARFVEETKKDNASSVVFDSSKGSSYLVQHYPMKRTRFFLVVWKMDGHNAVICRLVDMNRSDFHLQ